MSDIWWEPREIIPDRPQLEFLIEHIELLKVGGWPPQPKGYVENIVSGQKSLRMPGLIPLEWGIEVDCRLEKTGRDGLLCMLRYHGHMLEDKLAKAGRCNVGEIIHRINRAMKYMTGWGRRRRTYEQFIYDEKYKREKRKARNLTK